jgi:preprotein translocase subunit SecD
MHKQLSRRLCGNIRRGGDGLFATFHELVLLTMGVCLGCGTPPGQHAACPAIEVSVVADAGTDSTSPVALNDSTNIRLIRPPLVTSADVAGANASLTEGQWVLNLDVTDEAAKRVQEFSKQNVGRTMAFLIDGKVRSTPKILDPITGNGFLIGGFEQTDAERLATAIRDGCKR